MVVTYGKGVDKGVTKLMYVGDTEPSPSSFRWWLVVAVLGLGAYMVMGPGKRG